MFLIRPCKRCRSDLLDYHPMRETAEAIKTRIDHAFARQEEFSRELAEIGLSPRRIVDVFKAEYGVTPKAYADLLRVREARRLLADTDASVTDIAYQVGFGSLTAFYSLFKRETGKTPGEYRKEGMRCE